MELRPEITLGEIASALFAERGSVPLSMIVGRLDRHQRAVLTAIGSRHGGWILRDWLRRSLSDHISTENTLGRAVSALYVSGLIDQESRGSKLRVTSFGRLALARIAEEAAQD